MNSILCKFLGVFFIVNSANGLVCSQCQGGIACQYGLTLDIQDCDVTGGLLDKIINPQCFTITVKDGGNTQVARGCLPTSALNCKAISKALGWIVALESNGREDLSCDTCETDECNSFGRVGTIGIIAAIVLVACCLIGGGIKCICRSKC